MRVRLMSPDADFDAATELPAQTTDLLQDLQLDLLLDTMAAGDDQQRQVALTALLLGAADVDQARYRHEVLRDCEENRTVIEELFDLCGAAIKDRQGVYHSILSDRAEARLHGAVSVLGLMVPRLRMLRQISDRHAAEFASTGFRELFGRIAKVLDEEYLDRVSANLDRLRFKSGLLLSAELGESNTGSGFVVRTPHRHNRRWYRKLPVKPPTRHLDIPERDMAGFQALGELRDQVLAEASLAVSTASEEVVGFFIRLRTELMFFRGCLTLKETLAAHRCPMTLPSFVESGRAWEIDGLYDASLALDGYLVVSSELDAGASLLTVVTGANRGGKSTFLRATGIAALLARAGCFVPASHMCAELPGEVHTHFLREEDTKLQSGKLDEELARLSVTVDRLRPGALLLCNESFSSTNEREGGQIGAGVLEVLVDAGVRVVVVTHLFELAQLLWRGPRPATFLRADLDAEGHPTFRIVPGAPESTSHANVVFQRVFGRSLGSGSTLVTVGADMLDDAAVGLADNCDGRQRSLPESGR